MWSFVHICGSIVYRKNGTSHQRSDGGNGCSIWTVFRADAYVCKTEGETIMKPDMILFDYGQTLICEEIFWDNAAAGVFF